MQVLGGRFVVALDEYLDEFTAALEAIQRFNTDFTAEHGRPPELGDPLPKLWDQQVSVDDFGKLLVNAFIEESAIECEPRRGPPLLTGSKAAGWLPQPVATET